jgi:hypothetical protein
MVSIASLDTPAQETLKIPRLRSSVSEPTHSTTFGSKARQEFYDLLRDPRRLQEHAQTGSPRACYFLKCKELALLPEPLGIIRRKSDDWNPDHFLRANNNGQTKGREHRVFKLDKLNNPSLNRTVNLSGYGMGNGFAYAFAHALKRSHLRALNVSNGNGRDHVSDPDTDHTSHTSSIGISSLNLHNNNLTGRWWQGIKFISAAFMNS